jgi:Tfp pilus assembly protein PilF
MLNETCPSRLRSPLGLILPALLATALTSACSTSPPPGELGLPGDSRELYRYGLAALERGDAQRAVDALRGAVRREPSFQEAQYMLGRAAYETGDLGTSLRAFADALLLSASLPVPPYSPADVHYNLAVVLRATRQQAAAAEQLQQATRLEPDFALAWLRLAELQRERGALEAARSSLAQAVAAAPGLAEAQLLRARVAADAGDDAAAQTALRQAVLYDATLAQAFLELARLHAAAGRPAAALAPLDAYLELRPDDPAAWRLRGEVLEALGLRRTAMAAFDRAASPPAASVPAPGAATVEDGS